MPIQSFSLPSSRWGEERTCLTQKAGERGKIGKDLLLGSAYQSFGKICDGLLKANLLR